jgi:cation-transporting ATPase 13A3/4/5
MPLPGFKNGSAQAKEKRGSEKGSFDETKEYLNYGEEDQVEIQGYERSSGRTSVTWVFIILTLGLLRLIFHWWPQLMLYATHRPCSIAKAQKILVTVRCRLIKILQKLNSNKNNLQSVCYLK